MTRTQKSTALYPHPFSKAYWRDAAAELKDTRMLVVTALMVALRIALKPFAIYIGPQMAIQTATLATKRRKRNSRKLPRRSFPTPSAS